MEPLAPLPPLIPLNQFGPTCKICEQGELIAKRVYRLSGPVVAIGYILLVPSISGMIAAGLLLLAVMTGTGIGMRLVATSAASGSDVLSLLGTGIVASSFAIDLGIACFVSGLLGWLLVMKKRVLQCSTCGATVSAS